MSRQSVAAAILSADAAPEIRLVALMLQDAIEECRAGDATACRWLQIRAGPCLELLAGDDAPQWVEKLGPMIGTVQVRLFT